MKNIENLLFETESVKIADEKKPFWYTSGTIGPFFINTHYLYGGEQNANELLTFIDNNMKSPDFTAELEKKINVFYNTNEIYKKAIDAFYEEIKDIKEFKECDYISGGERRDWFFSVMIAELSKKKLLYIFKDLKISTGGKEIKDINNAKVVHICDLITQASSFKRAWIPAIKNINGKMTLVLSIIDRDEGGMAMLNSEGLKTYATTTINEKLLESAVISNVINKKQLNQIIEYKKNPDDFGKNFIIANQDFFIKSLADAKNKAKAERCLNENPYKIDFDKILEIK